MKSTEITYSVTEVRIAPVNLQKVVPLWKFYKDSELPQIQNPLIFVSEKPELLAMNILFFSIQKFLTTREKGLS